MTQPAIRPLPGARPRPADEQIVQGPHWRATVIGAGIIRLEWSDDGGFEDRVSTLALDRHAPGTAFQVERAGDGVVVRTGRVTLRYDGRPFSTSGLSVELTGSRQQWRYDQPFPNLGGTTRTLDEVDGRTELEGGVLSREGIAVIDDSESFLFDDAGWVASRVEGRRDLYIFAFGRDFEAAIKAFYGLAGRPALLPRWALGNWWSRYYPYLDTEYLQLVEQFEQEGLPFSVAVIDMDWHRVGSVPPEYGNGWTGYSWERDLFPDPAAFLAKLHERGLRVTLNLHPADGVRAFEDAYPALARRLGIDPATEQPIPFDATDPVFLAAYFEELHHPLEADGVDFWWIDWQQGRHSAQKDVDPLWVLNHYHHLDALRDGSSGMTFSRYAGPGSHRYAVGFSGDTVVSWESLAFQPEFTATAANIGYGWWSHDIGGHLDGIRDDQLATRWVQFGVFSPINRLHSASNPFIRKEPWQYPAEARHAMTQALRLRHQLVPYLHTMNHRAADGTPLVRPMYHLAPERAEAYAAPHQYAFGTELIVVPIVQPTDPVTLRGTADGWLPEGGWTDIFTGTRYSGDRFARFHRDITSIPVLLRDGGILPLAAPEALDATQNPYAMQVLVAPAASGSFVLIEDAVDAPGTQVAKTELTWDTAASEFRIGAAEGDTSALPAERNWTVTFFGVPPDGAVTDSRGNELTVSATGDRWSVRVSARPQEPVLIRLSGSPGVAFMHLTVVRLLLEAAQMPNNDKVAAWRAACQDRPRPEQLAELSALRLPTSLLAALTEILGA